MAQLFVSFDRNIYEEVLHTCLMWLVFVLPLSLQRKILSWERIPPLKLIVGAHAQAGGVPEVITLPLFVV